MFELKTFHSNEHFKQQQSSAESSQSETEQKHYEGRGLFERDAKHKPTQTVCLYGQLYNFAYC